MSQEKSDDEIELVEDEVVMKDDELEKVEMKASYLSPCLVQIKLNLHLKYRMRRDTYKVKWGVEMKLKVSEKEWYSYRFTKDTG